MSIEAATTTAVTTKWSTPKHSKKSTLVLIVAAHLCTLLLMFGMFAKGINTGVFSFSFALTILKSNGTIIAITKLMLIYSGLLPALLHIGIASIFKRNRNSAYRWATARGWAGISIFFQIVLAIVYYNLGIL